jgi:hypothetical protein
MDDFRITTGIARYTASFTPPASSYFAEYAARVKIAAALQQNWDDVAQARLWIDQVWGLKLGIDLIQPWSDAAVIQGLLGQYWGDAAVIRSPLLQQWRDAVLLRAQLDQPWSMPESLLVALEQQWSLTSAMVQGALDQDWDLKDIEQVVAVLHQPWAIATDGSVLRYTVEVLAGGLPVRVSHVNLEAALDQDVLTCEIHPETEVEYLLCVDGAPLQVTITSQEGTEVFTLVVTAPRIDEQHGETRYVVEAMSPLALLGEPYAATMDGELTGLASALAATLAAPLALTWQTVDWHIPPSTWIASGQTPLALLKQLAGAVGAVVQSAADGSVLITPEYPLALPAWATATPGLILTEILDCFTTGSTPDHRLGYNRYLIGDQMSSNDSLRLEEAAISATIKEVRGYQTPWTGAFALIHTGGPWVTIEPLGIEERQETEIVEIVAGSGRIQYPIYHRDAIAWGQVNLGSVTFAEDGSLSASVAGESLLTITYTTRCLLWRVRDAQSEQLQLVAEI